MRVLWLNPKNKAFTGPQFASTKWITVIQMPFYTAPRPLFDRTGTFKLWPADFNIDTTKFPIPQLIAITDQFNDLCTARARYIANRAAAMNQKIMLFYSGGLDSTCVLCSFILELGLAECQRRIIICMTDDGIEENPIFYNQFIKGKFETVDTLDFFYGRVADQYLDCVYVTGDIGLYAASGGVNSSGKAGGLSDMYQRYPHFFQGGNVRDHLTEYYQVASDILGIDNPIDTALELLDGSANAVGIKNYTFHDYWWWSNFNFKFHDQYFWIMQHCSYLLKKRPFGQLYWDQHYIPFFSDAKFQLWDYTNKGYSLKYVMDGGKISEYKKPLRDLIYSVNKDDEYQQQKGKKRSLNMPIDFPKMALLDLDYKTYGAINE